MADVALIQKGITVDSKVDRDTLVWHTTRDGVKY